MGRYDVLDKRYFSDPERFAELIEVGILKRREKINPEKLVKLDGIYESLRSVTGEYERDGLKLYEDHRVKYGVEIEKNSDLRMTSRISIYDMCEYEKSAADRKAVHKKKKDYRDFSELKSGKVSDEKEYPIVNVVLYVGMGRYKGSRSMADEFYELPSRVKPFLQSKIQNYSFTLMEADYVNPMDFETELRQFFEAMQARNDKARLLELFDSKEYQELSTDTKKIIAIHLDNKELIKKVVEEEVEMCKAIRDMIRDSKEEGLAEGSNSMTNLYVKLKASNRLDDWEKAIYDVDYKNKLLSELVYV